MSWTGKIAAIFSFRRISGQIAALILVSLILIHVLITGFFFVNGAPDPNLIADDPMSQLALSARIVAQTPRSGRRLALENLNNAFPGLQLRLRDNGIEPPSSATTGSRVDRGPEILHGASANADRIVFHLADGEVVEGAIRSPKLPPFLSGLVAATLLFLIVSITLLGVWAARALNSPLSVFARAAEGFSLDQSSAPIPETGPEEIRAAAKALNRMHERISALMNDRTRMLAAISHDLRTPITRLRLRSEYINDEGQRAETLRDLDQMQSMLESVLSLLSGGSKGAPTLVDIASLLQMICDEFSDRGHQVVYRGPSRAPWMVRPDELRRAVTNLIENAVRFGSDSSVALAVVGDHAVIEVSDNGPGIPDERKSAMLEPFVRGDEARTMDAASGFGLGLSIAEAVALAHGGALSLHDNVPHGLVARLLLANVRHA